MWYLDPKSYIHTYIHTYNEHLLGAISYRSRRYENNKKYKQKRNVIIIKSYNAYVILRKAAPFSDQNCIAYSKY